MRKLIAGTGWKMNHKVDDTHRYAETLLRDVSNDCDLSTLDIFVLPPFTSLHSASSAFKGSPVGIGAQNMHWEDSGGWTGEISAPMLVEANCQYVELAHSERLQYFGENYPDVCRKVDKAIEYRLIPIICLGESAEEKAAGRADEVIAWQMLTALANQPGHRIPGVVLAYEPRWAIGKAEAATPAYIAERHRALRHALGQRYGEDIAQETRIIYGGSVTPENGEEIIALEDVDGLFVGRAAWQAHGFARIIEIVAEAAAKRGAAKD